MNYKGAQQFRDRIICATLTGTPLTIKRIRSKDVYPGLADYEISFLQLLDKITSGSVIDINQTGTVLRYTPGIITNNPTLETVNHACAISRGISYYIEGIIPLVMYGKNKLYMILQGSTNPEGDMSVDSVSAVLVPFLKKLGVEIDLKLKRRGEDGEVTLTLEPIRTLLQPVNIETPGKIKRVRGTAWSSRFSVQLANRIAYTAKGLLHNFLPDIWIHTDGTKGQTALLGLTLQAETATGNIISSEFTRGENSVSEDLDTEVPEDIATHAVYSLLDEISYGGAIGVNFQRIPLYCMLLGPNSQSVLTLGRLSQSSILLLRLLWETFRVRFEVIEEEDGMSLKCIGIAYQNIARRVQ